MRLFPRTARRRLSVALVAALLAVGVLSAPLANADDLKDRQKTVERDIKHAQRDLDESSNRMAKAREKLKDARVQLDAARVELATAQGKVAVAQQRDAEMQIELTDAEAALTQARADLETGRTDMRTQQDHVASTISSIYEQGDPDLLAFAALLDSQTAADLTRSNEARNAIVGRDTRAYQELQAAKVLLGVRENQVEAAKEAVAAKREEAAEHLTAMQQLEADATAAEQSVVGLVGERRTAEVEAAAARAADARALKKLKKEDSRIEELLRKRAAAALRRARAAAARAHAQSGPPARSGGYLSPPANGHITSPFGYRIHPIYHYYGLHDGTDFGAACGSPLYAAADGKVISSYWSTVYGNRMIIDNGAVAGVGLATIYNHAVRYTVGEGQQVHRGEVIGYVGSTGWSTGCHLHFTVMANGKAVDPANWL
ncbi:peptidoglycan DD-metalloendopeptidase family protein [Nocardioides sp. LHG3406-4]|uniref:peptidoglycan DD-metalloendopeptidase family protein n=1 Tax=Nocardioides sp. LHG3406-4 TaxID=2804575 RepID=UPI003CF31653